MREIAGETVHSNPWFTVERRTYLTRAAQDQADQEHQYFMVNKPDSVLAVVRDGAGYVLVELSRPTLGGRLSTEFPQGGIAPGESPEAAVRREMLEETGLLLAEVRPVAVIAESSGFATSSCHVFTARAAGEGRIARDVFEKDMVVRTLDWEAIHGLVRAGAVHDSATLAALALVGTGGDVHP